MNIYVTQFFLIGGSRLLRIPLAILIAGLLSHAVGPQGVGEWSMIVAVAVFFHSMFLGWTQAQAVRMGREEWLDCQSQSKTWAARWPLIAVGIVVSVFGLWFRPYSFFEQLTGLPSAWWPVALICLFGIWALAEAQVLQRTTGRFSIFAAVPLVLDLLVASFLYAILVFAPNSDAMGPIAGIVVLTAVLGGAVWAWEFIASHSSGGRASRSDIVQVAKFGGPVVLGAAMGYLSDWGDHFLLQYFHGLEQVGLFQAGYQAMLAMMALSAPVAVIFLNKLVDQLRHDPKAEADYIRRFVPIVVLFWLLMIMPCIAVIPWIFTTVFGKEFIAGQPAFLILCIAVPGAIFTYLYTILFNIQERTGRLAVFAGAMAMANFAISLTLIPDMGGVGAAVGSATSYLLVQILYVLDQHRRLAVSPLVPSLLLLVAGVFGVVQLVIGDAIVWRFLWALVCMGFLILLGRNLRISENNLVTRLMPRRCAPIAEIMDRVLTRS